MAPPYLDFWFDFASTYSYPAVMRIAALALREAVAVNFRPFLLGPIFKMQGWNTSPFNLFPAKARNMWRDLERTCAELGLAFQRPEPFPQSSVLAARVALVGLGEGWGEDFCRAVFNAEFAQGAASMRRKPSALFFPACPLIPRQCLPQRKVLRSRTNCARRRPRRKRSIFSARLAFAPRMANSSGAMIDWKQRSPGQNVPAKARPDQGSSRTGRPARAIYSLASRTECSPKWKMEAARTALAWPSRTPSTRC